MHSVLRMPTDGKMKRMRKGKIIVLILMVFCILIFAIVVAWFLLSKDNYAVPENAATENAVLQVAGLTGNEPRDPQALKSLYVITSLPFSPPGRVTTTLSALILMVP